MTADLDAAADYGKKLPSANGKLFVAGFCWGGGKSFGFATHRHDLAAAFVFYGTPPADVTAITAPVYGFYAGNDARVSATVPATTEAMKAAGKIYDPVIYDGAGHGFMRAGQAPDASDANKKAWDEGFKRMVSLLGKNSATATTRVVPVRTKPTLVSTEAARSTGAAPAKAADAVTCHDAAATSDTEHGAMAGMAEIM